MTRNSAGSGNRRKHRLNTDAYVFAALLLISFSLLLVSTRSFVLDIKDAGFSVFSGARSGIHSVSSFISGTVNSIQELATLREQYSELVESNARYQQLERNAAEIRAENARLRDQLGFSEVLEYKHINAEIIGRDPDNLFSSLIINKGSAHGVEKDMPVIAYQNGMQALVGKIVQTGKLESLVIPLYDEYSKIPSRFAGSRYEGITGGEGSASKPLLVQSIDKRARSGVSTGDLVVTSGLGDVYPMGITIGRVSKVIIDENETTFETELESAINFSKLEYVFVIVKEPAPYTEGKL
jgi:rod shape-determining protein MreC